MNVVAAALVVIEMVGARQVAGAGVVIDANTAAVVVEVITTRIVNEVVVITLVVGVAAGIVWEAAAIAVIDGAEGAVLAETDAAGVIHDAAVIAFDEAKAIVGGATEVKHELVIVAVAIVDEVSCADEKMWCMQRKKAAAAVAGAVCAVVIAR